MVVFIELCSPDGEALLKCGLRDLTEFVDLTYRAVPEGAEAELVEIPDTVSALFGHDVP